MPEIKNNFLQGKMNKDLDERLLPNGQYRDALNIEVSTSEDSDIGTVKNILGNYRVEDVVDTTKFTCVGSVANEKTNKLSDEIVLNLKKSKELEIVLQIFNSKTFAVKTSLKGFSKAQAELKKKL